LLQASRNSFSGIAPGGLSQGRSTVGAVRGDVTAGRCSIAYKLAEFASDVLKRAHGRVEGFHHLGKPGAGKNDVDPSSCRMTAPVPPAA